MIDQVKGAQVILIMVHPSHRPRPLGRVRKRGDGVLALEIHGWGEVARIRFHNMCEEHLQHDMLSPASLSLLLESHLLLHIYSVVTIAFKKVGLSRSKLILIQQHQFKDVCVH